MEHILLAKPREAGNRSQLKQIRRDGGIPAVVYGNHKEAVSIYIDQRSFRKQFSHISESVLITLKIEGNENKTVLIKDFKEDLIKNNLEHIDFYEVSQGKILTTHVGIHLLGSPVGLKKNGIIEHLVHEVEIECLPKDLPEYIEVDIASLDIGMSISVKDLPQISGVSYKSSPEQIVVGLTPPKQVSLTPDTEENLEDEEEITEEE